MLKKLYCGRDFPRFRVYRFATTVVMLRVSLIWEIGEKFKFFVLIAGQEEFQLVSEDIETVV